MNSFVIMKKIFSRKDPLLSLGVGAGSSNSSASQSGAGSQATPIQVRRGDMQGYVKCQLLFFGFFIFFDNLSITCIKYAGFALVDCFQIPNFFPREVRGLLADMWSALKKSLQKVVLELYSL